MGSYGLSSASRSVERLYDKVPATLERRLEIFERFWWKDEGP